jgi:hypothetical protein
VDLPATWTLSRTDWQLFLKRREESITTEHEESVRQQILDGLIADKGGDQQISTATRILAGAKELKQEYEAERAITVVLGGDGRMR